MLKCGAGDGARTRHLRLGKAALYQMSYSRVSVNLNRVAAVRVKRLELIHLSASEPKSDASANSATPAFICREDDPSETRTPDPLIKSQMLYRLS